MQKIFVTRRLPQIAVSMLEACYEVTAIQKNEAYPHDELKEIVREYDGILCTISDKFDADVLNHSKQLKIISNYAIGLDNIDVDYAKNIGIRVCNTPDAVTNSTADLTMGLLLSLIRHIPEANDFVKNDNWKTWDPYLLLGEELANKKMGLLGFGRCGRAVARRALGFGLKVHFYDRSTRSVDSENLKGVVYEEYESLLETSDYLSIHLPLTNDTNGLIDEEAFKLMEKRPILINLARGDIIDNNSMLKALESEQIRGAALDVVASEPISSDHPLCKHERVLIVPHIGTATIESRYQMAVSAAQNIIDTLQ